MTDFDDQTPRLLSRARCEEICQRVFEFAEHGGEGGETRIDITGWWNGELRWARNQVRLAGDRRDITINVQRSLPGGYDGWVFTNQDDPVSLQSAVKAAERTSRLRVDKEPQGFPVAAPVLASPNSVLWSDATYNLTTEQRGALAKTLVEQAEPQGLFSAGYLELRACERAYGNTQRSNVYYETLTQAQCSITVRHPQGRGSGWAGSSGYDWNMIDASVLASRALGKCTLSLDPVRIEPGRYTVILEPQAVCDLMNIFMKCFSRDVGGAERGKGPFFLGYDESLKLWRSKLGLQVVDERITIQHDPEDPTLGVVPEPGLQPIVWIRNGVLTALEHWGGVERGRRRYALPMLNENIPVSERPAFRMSGGDTSVETMIATTKRGLLITRFSNLIMLDDRSVLSTGFTRDGLWLIENGQISKAVHNMRVTESPLFVLNRIEALGVPVPVFRPVKSPNQYALSPAIVPAIKSNDFSFTALADAV